jgi:hypothetical protein
MRISICICLAALALLGCGYDPDTTVYDTLANPDGYPKLALNLIDGIEKGQLATYDAITASFTELYSAQPDLLDNPQWEKIVGRLGIKFRLGADSLAALGIQRYREAADLYTLASFARPLDQKGQERKQLFDVWLAAVRDSIVGPSQFADPRSAIMADQLALLKFFLMGDSLHQKFGQDFLLQQLLDMDSVEAALKPSSTHPLTEVDRCFLAVSGLKKYTGSGSIVTFGEPGIELVAARITRQRGNWYAAELYFIPQDKLKDDFSIALRITPADSAGANAPSPLVFDFRAQPATTSWMKGNVYGAYRRFVCDVPLGKVEAGLYNRRADRIEFAPIRESGRPLFALPASVLPAH